MRRIALWAAVVAAAGMAMAPIAAQAAVNTYRCFHVHAPYHWLRPHRVPVITMRVL